MRDLYQPTALLELVQIVRELLLLDVEIGAAIEAHDDRRGVGGAAAECRGQGRKAGVRFARNRGLDELDFRVRPQRGLNATGLSQNGRRRRAGRRSQADRQLLLRSGVEELGGDVRHEHHGPEDKDKGHSDHAPTAAAIVEGCLEKRGVDTLDEGVVVFGAFVGIELDAIDEQAGHDRHHCQGADQGSEQGEGHGQGEGQEELADQAAHEAERQEDGDGRDRGTGDGTRDFTCARDTGITHRLAPAAVAVDVFEDDDGVVHHAADGYRETSQGHDVDRDSGDEHERKGRHDRDGDADGGHESGPQAHQEDEDRQDGEQRPERALAHEAVA